MESRMIDSGDAVIEAAKLLEKLAVIAERNKATVGGYLAILGKCGRVIMIHEIGTCPVEESKEFLTLACDQAELLRTLHLLGNETALSCQKQRKNGGAVATSDFIISFGSPLPPLANEALVLALALKEEWLTKTEVVRIAQASENPWLHQIAP